MVSNFRDARDISQRVDEEQVEMDRELMTSYMNYINDIDDIYNALTMQVVY